MADETVLDRSGKPYKPATRRKYKSVIDRYIVPALGERPVSSVHRRDVQDLVDQLRARGLSPSSVHNTIDPLRVIFRRAVVATRSPSTPGRARAARRPREA